MGDSEQYVLKVLFRGDSEHVCTKSAFHGGQWTCMY